MKFCFDLDFDCYKHMDIHPTFMQLSINIRTYSDADKCRSKKDLVFGVQHTARILGPSYILDVDIVYYKN